MASGFAHARQTIPGPSSRSGHRIFATDDFIYMLGGYDPNISQQCTFADAWRFNLVTERWDQVFPIAERLPKWLASFSLVPTSVSGEVLLFGGTGVPFGAAPSNKLLRINFCHDGTFVISSIATDGDALPRLYGQAMAYRQLFDAASRSFHDVVYLVGGTTGTVYNMNVWQVESAGSSSNNWKCSLYKCSDNDEQGRYRLEIVATDRQLIAFGGGSPGYCSGFEKLSKFDLQANKYVVLPTTADPVHGYPPCRKCHAIVEFEGGVYMIGGLNEKIDIEDVYTTNILNDVWRFDLETHRWQKLRAELPIPVFFHAAAITKDGCIYVFGGCTTKNSSERTNRLQRLWLRPPPLRHLAVRALLGQMDPEETNEYKCNSDVGEKPINMSQVSENILANVSRMFWPYYTGNKKYLLG